MPDYQGIGLGISFLSAVAKIYTDNKYQFSIVTSAKNMIGALNKSKEWAMIRYGTNKTSNSKKSIDYKRKSMRSNCSTASFKYIGKDGKVWKKKSVKKNIKLRGNKNG